jgi:hypothetical protein
MSHFKIDDSQLKKFQKLIGKEFPRGFQKVTAEYLNTMAFEQRKENKKNLEQQLTIRDQRFLNNSLWAQKTKPVSINQQIAISGSIRWQEGTGWEEQQYGKKPERKHAITTSARGGNFKAKALPKYRLNKANPVKPQQYRNNFQFMMRVLGSRGGGQFYLDNKIKTKKGQLVAGLWLMIKKTTDKTTGRKRTFGGKLILLQKKDKDQNIRRVKWENDRFEYIKQRGFDNAMKSLELWKQKQRQRLGL